MTQAQMNKLAGRIGASALKSAIADCADVELLRPDYSMAALMGVGA